MNTEHFFPTHHTCSGKKRYFSKIMAHFESRQCEDHQSYTAVRQGYGRKERQVTEVETGEKVVTDILPSVSRPTPAEEKEISVFIRVSLPNSY